VREALFSAIESWCGSLSGLRFLDLYAGSGAVGLEAWSRGAGVVTLVEHDRRTAALIGNNAKALGFAKANVVAAAVGGTLQRPPAAPYDVAFLDPPYPHEDASVDTDLKALVENDWLVPGAMVVVERSSRSPEPTWPDGFTDTRERRYGETMLWYGHAASLPS
jgi:16S rRNA (guanine966-N2)-methyltransferase